MEHAPLQHHEGRGEVRAAVVVDMALGADDLAVFHSGLVDALGGMALHAELGVLLPVENHLDRLADLVFRNEQRSAEHIREMLLAAEGAAGGALANDDVVIGNVQQTGNGLADVERALRRSVEHELPILIVGNGAVGLQVDMLLVRGGQGLLKDLVRLSENLLHGPALLAEQLAHDIAALLREHGASHAADALIDGHGRGLLGIVDLDLISQILQDSPVGAHHQADGLAHIQHIILSKAAPVLHDHPQLVLPLGGNILGGNKIIPLGHFRQVDGVDGASGDRRADHVGVLHIRQGHVADIGCLAPGFFDGIHADDLVADFRCWHCIASLMHFL